MSAPSKVTSTAARWRWWRAEQLGRLRRGGRRVRAQGGAAVGLSDPGSGAAGTAGGGGDGVGEYAGVGRRVRGLPGLPAALAREERQLRGVESGLGPARAAVGPERRG